MFSSKIDKLIKFILIANAREVTYGFNSQVKMTPQQYLAFATLKRQSEKLFDMEVQTKIASPEYVTVGHVNIKLFTFYIFEF